MGLMLSQNPEADALLDREPLALLVGMVLDQQIPLEWAFSGPLELSRRMGHRLDAGTIAAYDQQALVRLFAQRPALHRYPRAMADRVQRLCRVLVDDYEGDPTALWRDVRDGRELFSRIVELPGFGRQKAQIFVALLGKQCGVVPPGWREAAGEFGAEGTYRSVADITDAESLARVREYKQQLKAAGKAARKAGAQPPRRGARAAR